MNASVKRSRSTPRILIALCVGAMFLATAALASAKGKAKAKAHPPMMDAAAFAAELKVDTATATKVMDQIHKFHETMRDLKENSMAIHEELRLAVASDAPDEIAIEKLLAALELHHDAHAAERKLHNETIAALLTPSQRARLLLHKAKTHGAHGKHGKLHGKDGAGHAAYHGK